VQRAPAARAAAADVVAPSAGVPEGATVTTPARRSAPSSSEGQRRCRPRSRGGRGVRDGAVESGDVCLPTLGLSRRGDRGSPGDGRSPSLGSGTGPGTSVCGE
jgi:hypothetical protein